MIRSKLDALEARLASVARAAQEGFAERAGALRRAADRLAAGDGAAREEIRRLAHKLRGVGASAGHRELSERAARLEEAAQRAGDLAVAEGARRLAAAAERAAVAPDTSSAPTPAVCPDVPQPRLAGLRALALDDDELTRRLLALTLVKAGGAEAEVVGDAARALSLLREGAFDLLIVDAMMPELTGLELYHVVRRELGLRLPVAILSAASAEELGWELPDDPRFTWLRKPFRPAHLIDALAAFVRG